MTSPSISGPRQGGAPGASAALAAVVALAVGVAGGRASHGPDPMVPAGPGDYGQGSPPEEPDRGRRGWEGDGWADVVVGQPDFTEVTPFDVVAFKLFNPGGVAVDTRAGREHLYVWDSGNSRVVGVDLAACHAVGAPCRAAVILGQPSGRDRSACNGDSGFTAFPVRRAAGAGTLCGIPEDTVSVLEAKSGVTMAVDDRGRLFVPDFFNNRLLMYEDPFATDAIADAVWGQAEFTGNLCNRGAGTAPDSLCFASPYAAGAATALDGAGNLWVADGGNNRVLRYPARPNGGPPAPSADLVLGQADLAASRASPGLGGLDSPSGLAFDASGRLFVADTGHDRVLEYAPPFVSGMAAHGVVGRQLRRPGAVARDPAGSGVWISDPGNGMIERWDLDSPSATAVVGRAEYQPDGQCPGSVCPFTGGFAFDARGRLLVSAYGHKQDVLAFDVPAEGGAAAEPVAQLFSPPEGYNFADPRRPRGLGAIGGLAVGADQLVVGDGRRLVFWNDLEGLASGQAADGL
ncbi:MAG: NHL repeat-containing protein, partial [Anaerolineae bacterium]